MKRYGKLFARIANSENLLLAYENARDGKRSHKACFEFSRNLGRNLHDLEKELVDGSYQPKPCNSFTVFDGRKLRLVEAPAFRDLVVQHAFFNVVGPIFDSKFINTNFACRAGKGTHQAADWLQSAMRKAKATDWVLHVDVRKFFYSIDREVLYSQVERIVKCQQTLTYLKLFMLRDSPTGIPIGNLLSQTYANLCLNSLDQFCKRTLKVRVYGRYMDDSIMLAPSREVGLHWLAEIEKHLALLNLEISHSTLQPIKRGANFVGFRTWAKARFIRPHVISSFRRDASRKFIPGVISRLGHAKRTASFRYLITYLKNHHADIYRSLPKSLRPVHCSPTAIS